jgi:hypothetical protein
MSAPATQRHSPQIGESRLRAEGLSFDLAEVLFGGIVPSVFMTIETPNTRNFGETAPSVFLPRDYAVTRAVSQSFQTQKRSGIDNRYGQALIEGVGNQRKSLKFR